MSERTERGRRGAEATPARGSDTAVLVLPLDPRGPSRTRLPERDQDGRRNEAVGLCEAIGLALKRTIPIKLRERRPATLLGSGAVADVGRIAEDERAGLVVVDGALSPVQQRNLEKAWSAKVIDRTGLILEIFGERARTAEGKLQVELAHLSYQKSRLVRSWTHLERQRGGFGFLGGPGETQIEADRRAIETRISRIEAEIERIRKRRDLHRTARRRSGFITIALVGYTNAGKSTLFNRLTGADVVAKDQLFATLDPTMRRLRLPSGRAAVLSDTVGFISSLPTALVAAFRATLEEVVDADLLVHVRDPSSEEFEIQYADVNATLKEIGADVRPPGTVIEAWNKIDLVDPERRAALGARAAASDTPVALVSARTGEGTDDLLALLDAACVGLATAASSN